MGRLRGIDWTHPQGRAVFWHSTAHVLGYALQRQFPGIQLADGPPVRDSTDTHALHGGFFYEGTLVGGHRIVHEDLPRIQKEMERIITQRLAFSSRMVSVAEARELFAQNPFKLRVLQRMQPEEHVSLFKCGEFEDLCTGPHIENTELIKAVHLTHVSASHEECVLCQRVHGISFPEKHMLKQWIAAREEAARRDHRNIGKQQKLFAFSEYSKGSVSFLPHGTRIVRGLTDLIKKEYRKRGFEEVITPQLFDKELWEISGHWQNYKDDMFIVKGRSTSDFDSEEVIGLKPMNCPGHCLLYKNETRSYNDLPIRLADFSPLHRNEATGALTGLIRLRRFHQDDAHIFCREDQVAGEVESCLDFLHLVYEKVLGFQITARLSTRPEEFVGDIELWNKAEKDLQEILEKQDKIEWTLNPGDGAFYGPKIDIVLTDALQRKHQCATIQLDFQLPRRFGMSYVCADNTTQVPVIIHRAILGSFERMFAVLTEHYAGRWPFWLNPRQILIITVGEDFVPYARELYDRLQNEEFYVDIDDSGRTVSKKIREAQVLQYSMMLIIGEKEVRTKCISMRSRSGKVVNDLSLEELVQEAKLLADPLKRKDSEFFE
jgi:threonyl-tRNA synthetase